MKGDGGNSVIIKGEGGRSVIIKKKGGRLVICRRLKLTSSLANIALVYIPVQSLSIPAPLDRRRGPSYEP
jgi:hypothetical protein